MVQKLDVPGPRARALMARDHKVLSPSYTRYYEFAMSHGEGSHIYDVDGNRYVDFVAGIAVAATGYGHPKVVAAIKAQADKFLHISPDFYHENWVALAERLNEIAPFEEPARVFMANSGTETVEAAIKLAQYHSGRKRFIGFLGGFHGRTSGSLAFTASKITQRRGFATIPNVTHIPYPDPYRQILAMQPGDADYGETVVNYLESVIFGGLVPPDEVAAVLVEPIQGEGGYIVPPRGFFPRLREVCDKYGILLIADEIQSGVGRTGKWWAIQHWDTEPDIVCSAKGIANGVPFGAVIARESVMTWGGGSHSSTYGGNPLACAAALATLEVIGDGGMANAAEQGEYMRDALEEIAARHPSMGEVRGKGLMIGVEFVTDKGTRQPAKKLSTRIERLAFEHGLIMLGCGKSTMRFAPPLVIDRATVNEGLEIFEHVVTLAEKE